MFVYALTEPIDLFDGLTPLPQWIAGDSVRARWALRAVLALADAAPDVGWDGDMRHLPSIGALPVPPEAIPYLAVKQDNNGMTFVIADEPIDWLLDYCNRHTEITARRIGVWDHPTRSDLPSRDITGDALSLPPLQPGQAPF